MTPALPDLCSKSRRSCDMLLAPCTAAEVNEVGGCAPCRKETGDLERDCLSNASLDSEPRPHSMTSDLGGEVKTLGTMRGGAPLGTCRGGPPPALCCIAAKALSAGVSGMRPRLLLRGLCTCHAPGDICKEALKASALSLSIGIQGSPRHFSASVQFAPSLLAG